VTDLRLAQTDAKPELGLSEASLPAGGLRLAPQCGSDGSGLTSPGDLRAGSLPARHIDAIVIYGSKPPVSCHRDRQFTSGRERSSSDTAERSRQKGPCDPSNRPNIDRVDNGRRRRAQGGPRRAQARSAPLSAHREPPLAGAYDEPLPVDRSRNRRIDRRDPLFSDRQAALGDRPPRLASRREQA